MTEVTVIDVPGSFVVVNETFGGVTELTGGTVVSAPADVVVQPQDFQIEIGGAGPQGIKGDKGDPGPSGLAFLFTQPTPVATWVITHNLGRSVNVQVWDASGCLVSVAVVEVSLNEVEVRSKIAFAGTAVIT